VTANVSASQLRVIDADDSQFVKFEQVQKGGFDFDQARGCSDEAIAIACQYKGDPIVIDALLRTNVPAAAIIEQLCQPNPPQPPAPPPLPPQPRKVVISVSESDSNLEDENA
jgi:hypothetical protein